MTSEDHGIENMPLDPIVAKLDPTQQVRNALILLEKRDRAQNANGLR